MDLPSLN